MSMDMTWLDFQLSNQQWPAIFFLDTLFCEFVFLETCETWDICFSGSVILLSLSVLLWDWKLGYCGHFDFVNFNNSFSGKCLETWRISFFRGLRVHWHCAFLCAIQARAIAAILISSLTFGYWHSVLDAVLSDLWTFLSYCISRGVFECSHCIFWYLSWFNLLISC